MAENITDTPPIESKDDLDSILKALRSMTEALREVGNLQAELQKNPAMIAMVPNLNGLIMGLRSAMQANKTRADAMVNAYKQAQKQGTWQAPQPGTPQAVMNTVANSPYLPQMTSEDLLKVFEPQILKPKLMQDVAQFQAQQQGPNALPGVPQQSLQAIMAAANGTPLNHPMNWGGQ